MHPGAGQDPCGTEAALSLFAFRRDPNAAGWPLWRSYQHRVCVGSHIEEAELLVLRGSDKELSCSAPHSTVHGVGVLEAYGVRLQHETKRRAQSVSTHSP